MDWMKESVGYQGNNTATSASAKRRRNLSFSEAHNFVQAQLATPPLDFSRLLTVNQSESPPLRPTYDYDPYFEPPTPFLSSNSQPLENVGDSLTRFSLPQSKDPFPSVSRKLVNNNMEYQNLMIRVNELDLKIIEEQENFKNLKCQIKSFRERIETVKKNIREQDKSNKQKEAYCKMYAHYVEQVCSKHSYAFGQKIPVEIHYEQQLNRHKITLDDEQAELDSEIAELQQNIAEIRVQQEAVRNIALEEREREAQKKSSKMERQKERREQEARQMEELKKAQKLINQIEQMKDEEKKLQSLITTLKDVQKVAEEHQHSCVVLEKLIIMKETQKVYNEVYMKEASKEYDKILPDLKQGIQKRKQTLDILVKSMNEKSKTVNQLKEKADRKINRLSELELKAQEKANR